jgi:RHS repeat-associated protein
MIRAFRCLLPVLVLVLGAGVASAQVTTATGTPPFGSFGGGPEAINLGNLNAHWTIPIFNKPGRGTPLTVQLGYDTSIWYPGSSSGTTTWQPVANSYWGWTGLGTGMALAGQISGPRFQQYQDCEVYVSEGYYGWWQVEGVYGTFWGWAYQDLLNVSHPFGLTLTAVTSGSCPAYDGYAEAGTFTSVALDDSGYMLQVTANGSGNFSTGMITADGGFIVPGSSLTDRNGNQVTLSNGVYTDTLGTTALTVSSFSPPSPTTFQYTAPSTASAKYSVNYTNYTVATNFGVSGINEYKSSAAVPLVSSIVLPDKSQYTFTYEPTPSTPASGACTPLSGTYANNCVTARLHSITLPTGGTITYTYTGGGNGIVAADGSAAGLQRSTPDTGSSSYWAYNRTAGTGAAYTTTVTDPVGNQTVIQFQSNTSSSNQVTYYYETQRQTYQGSASSGTLLQTINTCYNGASSPCTATAVPPSISSREVWTQFGSNGLTRTHSETYGNYGWLSVTDYNYGSGLTGRTVSRTMATLGNNINDMPSQVQVTDVYSGLTQSMTSYAYDQGTLATSPATPQHVAVSGSRGNLTTVTYTANSNGNSATQSSYYDTGEVNTYIDVNGAVTTLGYGSSSCGNSFSTSSTVTGKGLPTGGLVSLFAWNCVGGVPTQATDANTQTTSTTYTDPYFWRPASVTDPTGATVNLSYGSPTSSESALNFNSGNSTVDVLTTLDGLGRVHLKEMKQSPSSTTYDTVETDYDSLGRVSRVTLPCPASAGQTCPSSWPGTTTTYDALNRPLTVTDGGGGSTTYSYTQNDVLVTVLPAPSGENPKKRQLEYDGLGRLTSVCEMTTATGSGTCGQTNSQTGFWTTYTYDDLDDLTSVTQNAQAATAQQQTRTYAYDMLKRLSSETNPESGTTAYTYDTDATCGTSTGDLVKKIDAMGNVTCYAYDAMHRGTSVTYSGPYAAATPNKFFVYDSATVNGAAMANAKGRLGEVYTAQSQGGTKITDAGFSYTARGEVSDVYQETPNSNGYYHVTQTYWPHGLFNQLSGLAGLPTISDGVDGEGRTSTVSASSGRNPVNSTVYNPYGTPPQTTVTFGSGDSDVFTFDPNTGRMTQYQYNVGNPAQAVTGNLTWNPNGTLACLAITDPFNSANNQICNYGSDDLTRVSRGICGSAGWGQLFSYDPFGNITKTVPQGNFGTSFQPVYQDPTKQTQQTTNRYVSIPGATVKYDTNGNVLNDGTHQYTWDADGNSVSVDGVSQTFDALDRVVEQNRSGVFTQIVYAPGGGRLALMSGQSLQKAFVHLPGAATAVYTAAGLDHYRHSDWLGSARFASTANPPTTMYADQAYAPFGEVYAQAGAANDLSFTGMDASTTSGDYDFPAREYDATAGRWPTPDPAGLAAADPADPQSWNRYAYVGNRPLNDVDLYGLMNCAAANYNAGTSECGGGGGGGALALMGLWADSFELMMVGSSYPYYAGDASVITYPSLGQVGLLEWVLNTDPDTGSITGSGSGNGSGANNVTQKPHCNPAYVPFINENLGAAQQIAAQLGVLPADILGLAFEESHLPGGGFSVLATKYNNWFGLTAGPAFGGTTGTVTLTVRGQQWTYGVYPSPGFLNSGLSFANSYLGQAVAGITDPYKFGQVLQQSGFNSSPGFGNLVGSTASAIANCL